MMRSVPHQPPPAAGSFSLPVASNNPSSMVSVPGATCDTQDAGGTFHKRQDSTLESEADQATETECTPVRSAVLVSLNQECPAEDDQPSEGVPTRSEGVPTGSSTMVDDLCAAFAHELQHITDLLRAEMRQGQEKIMALVEGERAQTSTATDQLGKSLKAQQDTIDQVAGMFLENHARRGSCNQEPAKREAPPDQHRIELLALQASVEDMRQDVAVSSEKRALAEVQIADLRKDIDALQEKMRSHEKGSEAIEKTVGGLYQGVEEITTAIGGSEQKVREQLNTLVKECAEREERCLRAAREAHAELEQKLREEQDSLRQLLEDLQTRHPSSQPQSEDACQDVAKLGESLENLRRNIEEVVTVVGDQVSSMEGNLDRRFCTRMDEERSSREADIAELRRCMAEREIAVAQSEDAADRPSAKEEFKQLQEEVSQVRATCAELYRTAVQVGGDVAMEAKELQETYRKLDSLTIANRVDALEEKAIQYEAKHNAITLQIVEVESELQRAASEPDVQRLEVRLQRIEEQQQRPLPAPFLDRVANSSVARRRAASTNSDSRATYLASKDPIAIASEAAERGTSRSIGSVPSTPRMEAYKLAPDAIPIHTPPSGVETDCASRHPSLAQLESARARMTSLLACPGGGKQNPVLAALKPTSSSPSIQDMDRGLVHQSPTTYLRCRRPSDSGPLP